MTIENQQFCEILDVLEDANAFVVYENSMEKFRISYPSSIIRKYFRLNDAYLLVFQCRSLIAKKKGNLLLVSKTGATLWWAERLRADDCYVEISVRGESIIAYDGTYNCHINISTGKIEQKDFVK